LAAIFRRFEECRAATQGRDQDRLSILVLAGTDDGMDGSNYCGRSFIGCAR
jgi:hypothetical protein